MTIQKTTEFCESDRYYYDRLLCPRGFATIDSESDASYYGNWASPKLRVLFSYVEGDCITIQCGTDQEFVSEVKRVCQWHKDHCKFFGIDPGLKDSAIKEWKDLGLTDYLH